MATTKMTMINNKVVYWNVLLKLASTAEAEETSCIAISSKKGASVGLNESEPGPTVSVYRRLWENRWCVGRNVLTRISLCVGPIPILRHHYLRFQLVVGQT